MGRTTCTEPQCLYKGDLYLYLYTNFNFFSIYFRKIFNYLNLMTIRPVGAELRTEGQTERQTDRQAKLLVAFRNFANAPKKHFRFFFMPLRVNP